MLKVKREILDAIREGDTATLHLIELHPDSGHLHYPYVVCWNLKRAELENASWDWGKYLATLQEACKVFNTKAKEHGFYFSDDYEYKDCIECGMCDLPENKEKNECFWSNLPCPTEKDEPSEVEIAMANQRYWEGSNFEE